MDATVIICTYNRAADLDKTLAGFVGMDVAPGLSWELLVLDNNSQDATRAVTEKYGDRLPVICLHEPRQGKGYALETGIATARGDLMLFTDDDVDVHPGWLNAMVASAKAHPEFDFFGGSVHGSKDLRPPAWYLENEDWLRANPRIDLGDKEVIYTEPGTARFIGANLGVRREVRGRRISFRTDLGPRGHFGQAGARKQAEEFELQNRLMSQGSRGIYVPGARMDHRDPPHRLTERYLRYFYREQGREFVQLSLVPPPTSARRVLGAPAYLWKELLLNHARYIQGRLTGNSGVWLRAAVAGSGCWGQILAYRAQRAGRAAND